MSKKKAKKSKQEKDRRLVGFLGIGLDHSDEHQRLTRTEHFFLIGGSEATHERMQETAIRFNEGLAKKGMELAEASLEEMIELFHDSRR